MKKFLLCVLLCLTTATFAKVKPEVYAAYQANRYIAQVSDTGDRSYCSATAIGPQALLTATHCEVPNDVLHLLGSQTPLTIVGRIRDGHDHTIYLIEGYTFTHMVEVDQNHIDPSERVFIWGNPGELHDIYREGVLSGVDDGEGLFDLQVFPGDSGGGIFSAETGKLVAVIMATNVIPDPDNKDVILRLGSAVVMKFKPEDLEKAKTFKTETHDGTPNTNGTTGQPAH